MAEHHCLTCAIRDAVLDHFEAQGDLHGDVVVVDCKQVVDAVAGMVAESLAIIDDGDERSRALAYCMHEIINRVNDIRAKGEQAGMLRPS